MKLSERNYSSPTQVELPVSYVADLQPIVRGPGFQCQLPARDRKLAIGVVSDRQEREGRIATADGHLTESALPDVSNIICRQQLPGGNRDRASGIDCITCREQRGGINCSASNSEYALR